MKILLITYYFPPCGGAAVQRWLRFINALDKKGVEIFVVTTLDGDYPYRDESLLSKIPATVKVLRSKPISFGKLWNILGQKELPYGSLQNKTTDKPLQKFLYWLRLNVIVPDLRIGWNPAALKSAVQVLRTNKIDYVITTGPPHSTHLIGLKLKKRYNIQWRTDFRDPMSEIYYLKLNPPMRLTMALHKYLERKIIRTAELNYIVSKAIANSLPEGNKEVLYNGFDPDDFKDLHYERTNRFRIKYVGQLTAGQDPTPLINALAEIKLPNIDFSLIGTRDFPETDFPVNRIPFLPHQLALQELINAELLILIINTYEGNEGMLTTKLFEYIASRSPILCLADSDGEAYELICKTESGFVSKNTEEIIEIINKLYERFSKGDNLRTKGDISFLDVNNQIQALLKV
ncbi:MAG: glycosyl transferase [Candidatus Cloacimonetes bacterium]|jgi:glycosyltransferase involved in cell wall biosynthesis|nr:glycosyl transferase [Candidatus Cloacimonadota bacterium]HQB49142.1 glycosyl transferase [Candidatus Cloacimonas sp.]HQM16694.1 glycosyl transferase [Candidatus Cloacimonas sp.]